MERNHEDDGPSYALSAGATRSASMSNVSAPSSKNVITARLTGVSLSITLALLIREHVQGKDFEIMIDKRKDTKLILSGMQFFHRQVQAAGLRFHLVEGGSGPVVVFLAGFPQSWYAWRRVLPLLGERFTVVAIDLPGQGDSEKPLDGYDTQTTGQRVHSLLSVLGHRRYVLVGHDIGSWVAYPYAYEYADELRGVVLLDGNIPGVTLQPTITLERF